MATNFTYPPLGSFDAVSDSGAVSPFDTLVVAWETTLTEARVLLNCKVSHCSLSEDDNSCDEHQYVNSGPKAGNDSYTLKFLNWAGLKNVASSLTQLPQVCAVGLKDWAAIDEPPRWGSFAVSGTVFTITGGATTSTTYTPTQSSSQTTPALSSKTGTVLASPDPPSTSITWSLTTVSSTLSASPSNSNPSFKSTATTKWSSSTVSDASIVFTAYSTPVFTGIGPSKEQLDLTKGARIGISIGSGLGGLILIALLFISLVQWRKLSQTKPEPCGSGAAEDPKPELPAYAERIENVVGKDVRGSSEELHDVSEIELESPRDAVSRQYHIDLGHVHELH